MDFFGDGHADWPEILQMLQSDEEWIALSGVTNLQQKLMFAQEYQMAGFQTEAFMSSLCKHVNNQEALSDFSDEIKYNAIQCLTSLMDLFPNVVNFLINAGIVDGLSRAVKSSFTTGFQDITVSAVRAFG